MKSTKKRILTIVLTIAIITVLIASVCAISYSVSNTSATSSKEESTEAELKIEFFPLGNYQIGDSCIITFGDVQILVDAGSRGNSAETITQKMKAHMDKDKGKVWEYIIVTHPDEDHIAAFSTSENANADTGVFQYLINNSWEVGTLIDFDVKDDYEGKESTPAYVHKTNSPAGVYNRYSSKRDSMVKAKQIENYKTAMECQGESFYLASSDKNSPKLTILQNRYYTQRISGAKEITSAEKNNMSVCFLIEYKSQSFLFTGDLEEKDSASDYKQIYGETYLYEDNKALLEGGVTFYKAAHHGSRTSNSKDFIDKIRPQIVAVSTVAGTSQHHDTKSSLDETGATTDDPANRFPAQEVLSNLLKYTDMIYITSYAELDPDTHKTLRAKDYYGDITISSNGYRCKTTTSGESSNGKPSPITSSSWFNEKNWLDKPNRIDEGANLITTIFELPESIVGLGQCTLVQYRSYDILIDCGIYSAGGKYTNRMEFIDKIAEQCADGVLEYVIVTSSQTSSISNMIGSYSLNGKIEESIFKTFEVETLIDFGESTNIKEGDMANGMWITRYVEQREEAIENGTKHNPGTVASDGSVTYKIDKNLSITILNQNKENAASENNYSLCTLIKFGNKKLFFTGRLTTDESCEQNLAKDYKTLISKVDLFVVGNGGASDTCSKELINVINPKHSVICATAGSEIENKEYPSIEACERLVNLNKEGKVYVTSQMQGKHKKYVCGDMTFIFSKTEEKPIIYTTNDIITVNETQWYQDNIDKVEKE